MAIENETADQVVRMVLQGSEVVLKLSGEAAMRLAGMFYSALKGDLTTKGKATLWEFLKSGKDQVLFQIPDEYLKAFTTASRKYGFPFVVLKDKTSKDGKTDIMVYKSDSPKVDRVIEAFNLKVETVNTVKPEVMAPNGELVKTLGMKYSVPFKLIDNMPEIPKHNRRLLAELQKYAEKMKKTGPQVVEPVGLLCKPNGRYELLPGQGAKRIIALRLAGYNSAVAEILVPKKDGVEVTAENIDARPSQERSETAKTKESAEPIKTEKTSPTKETAQTANPTMARTSRSPASGQGLGQRSKVDEKEKSKLVPEERESVRKKLGVCREIAADQKMARNLNKPPKKISPFHKKDLR